MTDHDNHERALVRNLQARLDNLPAPYARLVDALVTRCESRNAMAGVDLLDEHAIANLFRMACEDTVEINTARAQLEAALLIPGSW